MNALAPAFPRDAAVLPSAPVLGRKAIELEAAGVTFGRGAAAVPALSPTTMDIREGEFVALVGPCGVGKTPTLLTLAGLVPPQGGERTTRRSDVAVTP